MAAGQATHRVFHSSPGSVTISPLNFFLDSLEAQRTLLYDVIIATLLSITVVCDMSFECTLYRTHHYRVTLLHLHPPFPISTSRRRTQKVDVKLRTATLRRFLLIDACHLLAAGFFICNTRVTSTHTRTQH